MAGKRELVDQIVASVDGCSRSQAEAAVDSLVEAMTNRLKSGERVMVPGFGTLSVKQRSARTGRNPMTGARITIDAARVARFKMAKNLKAALAGDPVLVLPDLPDDDPPEETDEDHASPEPDEASAYGDPVIILPDEEM